MKGPSCRLTAVTEKCLKDTIHKTQSAPCLLNSMYDSCPENVYRTYIPVCYMYTHTYVPTCRNILKSNDVRTGLKKPEQESSKRAAANEPAQLAAAAEAADVARAELVQAADMSTVNTNTQETSEPAAAAVGTGGSAHAAPSEWDIAKAARDRCARVPLTVSLNPPPLPTPACALLLVGAFQCAYVLVDAC